MHVFVVFGLDGLSP